MLILSFLLPGLYVVVSEIDKYLKGNKMYDEDDNIEDGGDDEYTEDDEYPYPLDGDDDMDEDYEDAKDNTRG